jgi:Arc/MetJ-type ribon-helix-helix transcriptional regulator
VKTIAITIDEETLRFIDQYQRSSGRYRSRSAFVRAAIRAYAARESERRSRARELRIIRQHKNLLDRQLKAMVRTQANP